ncbi:MAG: hypothetical protein ACLRPS_05160 [Paraprevotella clara]|uniref:tRNA nuclease CdiA C-terminal domain-containing protein n=1 Tax=Paraprevotella clara TaxID=454154 RepID=A0A6N3ENK4_9BACT
MAKTSGGVRTYRQGSSTYRKRQVEVEAMRQSGKYSSVEMGKGGGYVAIEKSTARHKPEELEAARILAGRGYKVVLKDESGGKITPDGFLFKASFEQRTPQVGSYKNFVKGLEHAKKKVANIAVMYDKYGVHTRSSVEKGISQYEYLNKYRFKEIIVISKDGRIHRHKHNK